MFGPVEIIGFIVLAAILVSAFVFIMLRFMGKGKEGHVARHEGVRHEGMRD